jgi:hypothetical protein
VRPGGCSGIGFCVLRGAGSCEVSTAIVAGSGRLAPGESLLFGGAVGPAVFRFPAAACAAGVASLAFFPAAAASGAAAPGVVVGAGDTQAKAASNSAAAISSSLAASANWSQATVARSPSVLPITSRG